MKTIQILLFFITTMMMNFTIVGQDYAGDFNWVGTNTNNSVTTVRSCGVINTIRLNTTPAVHGTVTSGGGNTSTVFPTNLPNNTPTITVTLQFSQPVCNLRLKVNDLDFGQGRMAAETMTTNPMFTNIAASINPPGPLFNNMGGTLTPPLQVDNTLGWVEFDNTPLTTVTLTYNRVPEYWAFLDSLTYDCCRDCMCDNSQNTLAGSSSISNNGGTLPTLNVNSSGVPIKRLNISIPFYESLADPGCILCNVNPAIVSKYGKILNFPAIAGVTPTFTGTTVGGSSELVYEFPTPTVINQSVVLKLQFPPTILSCDNKVRYCVKLGFIDADCNICEQLLCVEPPSTTRTTIQTNDKALLDGQLSRSDKMLLSPNPASSVLNVVLPSKQEGSLQILDLNGKIIQTKQVLSDKVTLDVEVLHQGTYFLKYTSGETVITETFIKQ